MKKNIGTKPKKSKEANMITKVIICLLSIILPVNILVSVLGLLAVRNVQEQAVSSLNVAMSNVAASIDGQISSANYFLYNIRQTNPDYQKLLTDRMDDTYTQAKIQVFLKFNDQAQLSTGKAGYFFYQSAFDDLTIVDRKPETTVNKEKFLRSILQESSASSGWTVYPYGSSQVLLMTSKISDVTLGAWIWLNDYEQLLHEGMNYQSADFTFYTKGEIIPAASSGTLQTVIQSPDRHFRLAGTVSAREVLGGMSAVLRGILILTPLSLLVIPLLYMVISKLFMKPLGVLDRAHEAMQKGDLDYRITETAPSREYALAFDSFNTMADNIRRLKIENYEKELNNKELTINNLQLQIRPHFLLNTFNLIYTLVQERKNSAAQDIIIYLSDYFRYLFRSEEKLELFPKEQHLIEEYIKMAKVRYPGSIEIEYQYDPEIMMVRVPPLLLHNFVENIVMHVVKLGRVTHITIIGEYADGIVNFMIMDDSDGLTEEEVRDLDRNMRTGGFHSPHVGMINSYRRVKYFYGEKGDITISSEPGVGTCYTVTFPYDLEDTDDASDRK